MSWKEFDKLVISPEKTSKLVWDVLMCAVFIVNILISSIILAFHLMIFHELWRLEYAFDWIVFVDLIANFITAYERGESDSRNEEDKYERRLKEIITNYLSTHFIFDFISVVPVLICEFIFLSVFKIEPEELQGKLWFRILYWTKLMRINHISRVTQQFSFTMRVIAMRYMHLSVVLQNTRTVLSTFLTLFLALHMFASVFIYLGCLDDGWYLKDEMVPDY